MNIYRAFMLLKGAIWFAIMCIMLFTLVYTNKIAPEALQQTIPMRIDIILILLIALTYSMSKEITGKVISLIFKIIVSVILFLMTIVEKIFKKENS